MVFIVCDKYEGKLEEFLFCILYKQQSKQYWIIWIGENFHLKCLKESVQKIIKVCDCV